MKRREAAEVLMAYAKGALLGSAMEAAIKAASLVPQAAAIFGEIEWDRERLLEDIEAYGIEAVHDTGYEDDRKTHYRVGEDLFTEEALADLGIFVVETKNAAPGEKGDVPKGDN